MNVINMQEETPLRGARGAEGPRGFQGPQGVEGPQGVQGPPGRDGVNGKHGINGMSGKQGPMGSFPTDKFILKSKNGTSFVITISDDGEIITTKL